MSSTEPLSCENPTRHLQPDSPRPRQASPRSWGPMRPQTPRRGAHGHRNQSSAASSTSHQTFRTDFVPAMITQDMILIPRSCQQHRAFCQKWSLAVSVSTFVYACDILAAGNRAFGWPHFRLPSGPNLICQKQMRVLVEEKLQLFFSLWLVNSSLVAESSG